MSGDPLQVNYNSVHTYLPSSSILYLSLTKICKLCFVANGKKSQGVVIVAFSIRQNPEMIPASPDFCFEQNRKFLSTLQRKSHFE